MATPALARAAPGPAGRRDHAPSCARRSPRVLRGAPWIDRFVARHLPQPRTCSRSSRRHARGARAARQRRRTRAAQLVCWRTARVRLARARRGVRLRAPRPQLPALRRRGARAGVNEALHAGGDGARYYLDLVRRLGCPDLGTNDRALPRARGRARVRRARSPRRGIDARPAARAASAPGRGLRSVEALAARVRGARSRAALRRDGAQVALVHGAGRGRSRSRSSTAPGARIASARRRRHVALAPEVRARARAALICNDARRAPHRGRVRAADDRADGPDGGGLHQSEPEAH